MKDTDRLPEVRINREGNFDAVRKENENALEQFGMHGRQLGLVNLNKFHQK